MSDIGFLRAYLTSLPVLTTAFLGANAVMAVIGYWPYGVEGVVRGVPASLLLALALKFMLLAVFHTRQFAFPRRIAPVAIALLAFCAVALALVYPILRAACTEC